MSSIANAQPNTEIRALQAGEMEAVAGANPVLSYQKMLDSLKFLFALTADHTKAHSDLSTAIVRNLRG